MNTKLSNILRWIVLLPGALLSSIASYLAWSFFSYISIGGIIDPQSFIYGIYALIVSNIITGYVFIFAGRHIAPTAK